MPLSVTGLPPAPATDWKRRAQPLLGTLVEIAIVADSDAALRQQTAAAFERVARFHAAMSFHSADSDLAAIARCRGGEQIELAPETWETLALALALEVESAGAFNVAIAPVLVHRGLLPSPAGAEVPTATSARAALRLLPGGRVQVLAPVWIDLGGIAKGAAVDAAVAALQAAGVAGGVVNAGGDLRAFGAFEQTIELRHPLDATRSLPIARLSDGAFATSSNQFRSGALVAPRGVACGPTDEHASVSVAAPTCAVADALTKVVALVGPAAAPLLRSRGAHAVCVDGLGQVRHV